MLVFTIVLYYFVLLGVSCDNDYWKRRKEFVEKEKMRFLGSEIILSREENILNRELMRFKKAEYAEGLKNISNFFPANHFFDVKDRIENSYVFHIIKKLAKGAMLHGHLGSMVSTEFLFHNITHLDNLHICINNENTLLFKFSRKPNNECKWQSLKELRYSTDNIDKLNNWIKQQLTILNDHNKGSDSNLIWESFQRVFKTVKGLIRYRHAFELYLYQMMQELYDDNIMYLELRSSLPKLYEISGKELSWQKSLQVFQNVVHEFMRKHPDFLGVKLIYSPRKIMNEIELEKYINKAKEANTKFPNMLVGFDLVGHEDYRKPIREIVDQLQKIPKKLSYFFHSGETNWQDMTDMNLIDAVLLNSTRIGHGYALTKHPFVLDVVKKQRIGIEVCPISNQVLGLVKDLRNHPAAHLFSDNYPVVICSDDPSFWGAKGLSYDMYETFMGLTGLSGDIKVIKQLAINSIIYSAMSSDEKYKALEIWRHKWKKSINDMLLEMSLLTEMNVS